jgi:hypothetical protein
MCRYTESGGKACFKTDFRGFDFEFVEKGSLTLDCVEAVVQESPGPTSQGVLLEFPAGAL